MTREGNRGHVAITALKEGPFTTLQTRPLTVTLDVPAERLMSGDSGAFKDIPCPRSVEALLGDRAFLAQHA